MTFIFTGSVCGVRCAFHAEASMQDFLSCYCATISDGSACRQYYEKQSRKGMTYSHFF